MKLYLIRHGMTKGNLEGRYVGSTDEDLLPEERERLDWTTLTHAPLPAAVYVSPMKRCLSTAAALFRTHKVELGALLRPMHIVEDFREMDFGAFEYRNYRELNGLPSYQRYLDSGGETAFPFGESKAEFCRRVARAGTEVFAELTDANKSSAALIVHGGTIMALLDAFSDPHEGYFHWQVKNGCGYEAELIRKRETFALTNIRMLPEEREDERC